MNCEIMKIKNIEILCQDNLDSTFDIYYDNDVPLFI